MAEYIKNQFSFYHFFLMDVCMTGVWNVSIFFCTEKVYVCVRVVSLFH